MQSRKSVEKFQIKNNLKPTGKIDQNTDQLLQYTYNKRKEENEILQNFLKNNGDYNGGIDGIIGKKTLESLATFKKKYGLNKYNIDIIPLKSKVDIQFKNQRDFLNYYKRIDVKCTTELCISKDMSISLSNSCIPVSLSLSSSDGIKITIEASGISYDIKLVAGNDKEDTNRNDCKLSRTICFSENIERNYSLQCNEDETGIEIQADKASISYGNLSVSLLKLR